MANIAILGAGAIGQLLCWQLRQYQPLLLGQRQAPKALIHTDIHGQTHAFDVHYRQLPSAQLSDIKLVIVTVKAYQVDNALSPLLTSLPDDCAILLLHNGMGPHITLAPKLKGRLVMLGTTSQGALRSRDNPWHVTHTGMGLTQIGVYLSPSDAPSLPANDAQALAAPLLSSLENCQWVNEILPALWQKLAVNAAINPLTAIYDCRNGALAAAKHQAQIEAIVSELVAVAKADGVELAKAQLLERVNSVIKLTANNFSSMHQDLSHGRQTEIDAINGFVVSRARAHQLNASVNLAITEQVNSLSAQQLSD